MVRRAMAGLVASVVLGIGCSSNADAPAPVLLDVTAVAWNPSAVDVGVVQAVAEEDRSLLVFGSQGIQTFASGSLVSSDKTITTWRSAAAVPSADGLSTWLIGVDAGGHVQRVMSGGPPQDVSERYGLGADKVQSVAAGAGRVAFLLDEGVAVSDGANVTRYRAPARAIAAAGGLIALADGSAVRIFDHGKETDVALAGAALVTYDAGGNLLAATSHALYRVVGASAEQVYDAGGRTIHQLTGAGPNVWLAVDGDLAVWEGGQVAVAAGGTLAPDARLVGSASGDVWVVTGGQLLRWSAQAAAGGDEATWSATVQPVYAAVCSNCHSPRGSGKDSSNIDLSTYGAWKARRPVILARVVTQAATPTSMPPPNSGYVITDAQRAAIEAWSKP